MSCGYVVKTRARVKEHCHIHIYKIHPIEAIYHILHIYHLYILACFGNKTSNILQTLKPCSDCLQQSDGVYCHVVSTHLLMWDSTF